MKWKLIEEAKTPSDMKSIEASFNKDVSPELFIPSIVFLELVYGKMNRELFFGELPDAKDLKLAIGFRPKSVAIGTAKYKIFKNQAKVVPVSLVLNGARMTTLHGWIEIVLHEMIHIYDFVFHPEHFLKDKRYRKEKYNPHGEWFLSMCENFKRYGMNIAEKYDGVVELNDTKIAKILKEIDKEIYVNTMVLKAGKVMYKILEKNKEEFMKMVAGIAPKVKIYKTSNPNSINLKVNSIRTPLNKMKNIVIDGKFEKEYGPFELIEEIDTEDIVLESLGYEDDYIKWVKTHIMSVEEVKKVGAGTYEVTIS